MPQDYPLIRTKTIVPRLRDSLVPRQRLVDLYTAIFITSWFLSRQGQDTAKLHCSTSMLMMPESLVCWYSLDENDNSLGTF